MTVVKAKKHLGQHFLKDQNIASKIVESLQEKSSRDVLEIGPGMGVLTQFLVKREDCETYVVELDKESVKYLEDHYPELDERIISGDFLKLDLLSIVNSKFDIIGNFPYNISSQIFFKVLDYRNHVDEVVGMIQKEVADRIVAPPGSKTYGILSVLLQAWYDMEYLFTVHENVFIPPPKVKSAVIRMKRNQTDTLDCDEKLFFRVVKATFNQRRKTIRNSLKSITKELEGVDPQLLSQRPEQLGVSEFIELTKQVENCIKK
ncbi:16S rRNA (adenine(1518)-N(6)/adenine(1519)-N(6))-dimethyltransferase RsmA [Puteibacter caeruleilacunae]|nr:16S rRNA (adenine(1518)-N(6)/adenine(1519)-N(6))-dimethyltransferase RsmA [Puteibacter caeruleilacunae]